MAIKFRKDSKGKFRWRIVADDGRILGVALNGENDQNASEQNLKEIFEEILKWMRQGTPKDMDNKPRTIGEWKVQDEE